MSPLPQHSVKMKINLGARWMPLVRLVKGWVGCRALLNAVERVVVQNVLWTLYWRICLGNCHDPEGYCIVQDICLLHRFNLTDKEGSADRKVPVQPLVFHSKDGKVSRYNLRKVGHTRRVTERDCCLTRTYMRVEKLFGSYGCYHWCVQKVSSPLGSSGTSPASL
jgi:hypothetical protein